MAAVFHELTLLGAGAGNGIVFLIVGLLATVVGMSLFFDRTLIRIGTVSLQRHLSALSVLGSADNGDWTG